MDQRSSSVDSAVIAHVVTSEVEGECRKRLASLPKGIADDVLETMCEAVDSYRSGDVVHFTANISNIEGLIREKSEQAIHQSDSRGNAKALLYAMAGRDIVSELTGLSFREIAEIRDRLEMDDRASSFTDPTVMEQEEIIERWEAHRKIDDLSMRLIRVAAKTRFNVSEVWTVVKDLPRA